jgi:putative pyruvate formate lyase activating enzyme
MPKTIHGERYTVIDPYQNCRLCPRNCGVDRLAGNGGFCGETADLRIAAASIHRGEEPPVTGAGGSGTIFITGCTLGCVFCQNWQISQNGMGRVTPEAEFVRICLALQEQGAENINIVTGSHAAPAIVAGITAARDQGLRLPLLWNSSAYESGALDLLEPAVDVYLPDLKTLDRALSRRFFKTPDYPDPAVRAISRMMEMRGTLRFEARASADDPSTDVPVLVSGVIIRHLVLPGYVEATREVLRWFAEHAQKRALLSLMMQYTPVNPGSAGMPDRYVSQAEYDAVLGWLEEFDIEDGFCQELVPDSGWLPNFKRRNPFRAQAPAGLDGHPAELSTPVWHWAEAPQGFLKPPNSIIVR